MTTFLKISVEFKMWIILFAITSFFAPNGISELSENTNVSDWSVHKFGLLKLARSPRETIVGNGCPKGRFRYYGKCKSYEELRKSDYNDIDVTNEAQTFTPTITIRENKFVETLETDINLSILPLSRPDVTTESNFVRLNSVVKTLGTVEKSTRLVSELNPSVATQTPEVTSLSPDVSVSSDFTPTVLETTTAMADTVTRIDSTFAVLEISPVEIKSKSVMTAHENILKDIFTRDSAATANSTPTTTWKEPFSNLASEPTSSLTNTRTTVKDSALTTTDMPSKGVPDIFDQNDRVSNILLEVKYFMFTLVFVVTCVSILNWIYEQLCAILNRRRDQENRGVHLSKEQESMV